MSMEIGFLLVGLLFGYLGFYLIWDHSRFLAAARTVEGRVKAIEKRTTEPDGSRKEGGPIYYPVIHYVADGRSRSFTSKYGMSLPQYEIGQSVLVAYSRGREEARIKQKTPFIVGGIFAAIGVGLCVLFFHIFNFSLWSAGMASIVLFGLFFSVKRKLNNHDISTLDEFKEAFRNTNMKTARGTEPEVTQLITDKRQMEGDIYKRTKSLRWVGPLFTAVGIGIVVLGIYLGKSRAAFLEAATPGRGEVVSLNAKSSDDGYVYYPVVRYLPDGTREPVTFEHDVGSNPPSYEVGEQVRVLYRPSNPSDAIIDAGVMNWFGPGLTLLLGLIFTGAGILSINRWMRIKETSRFKTGQPLQ